MLDTRPVEVVLQLPEDLAEGVEEVKRNDPDFLKKVIRYGLTRRAVFRALRRSHLSPDWLGESPPGDPSGPIDPRRDGPPSA